MNNSSSPRKALIAPSILAADFSRLGEELHNVESAGADLIHIDVMDGSFVPPISFGEVVVEMSKKVSPLLREVHLMIINPSNHINSFVHAGAQRILIHQEADVHLHRTLESIRNQGCEAGVALNPATPVETIFNVLEYCQVVLIMTVNPGWGGQSFIESTLQKITQLRKKIDQLGLATQIEVDGGINSATVQKAYNAGADIFVAGTAVFRASNYSESLKNLRP